MEMITKKVIPTGNKKWYLNKIKKSSYSASRVPDVYSMATKIKDLTDPLSTTVPLHRDGPCNHNHVTSNVYHENIDKLAKRLIN